MWFTQGRHISVWLLILIILNDSEKQISPITVNPRVLVNTPNENAAV